MSRIVTWQTVIPTKQTYIWRFVYCHSTVTTLLWSCNIPFRLSKWLAMSTTNARSCTNSGICNCTQGCPFMLLKFKIPLTAKKSRFSSISQLSHLTSVWYGNPLLTPSSLRRLSNWWWFRPLARIKLTALTTTITWHIFCDLQHNASSWIKQWNIQKSSPPFAVCTFSFNFATTPAFFSVIEGALSVATLTAQAQTTPTLSDVLTNEPKTSSAFVIPIIGTNWTNSLVTVKHA